MTVSSPSTLLDRSAAKLAKTAPRQPVAPSRPSVPGAPASQGGGHVGVGGGMLPPPSNMVALSDGTRISFRAVEELPELADA